MPYFSASGRLPSESASKLGHITIIQSEWVQSLINDFENGKILPTSEDLSIWQEYDPSLYLPLKYVWAVDGSFVKVTSNPPNGKEVAFIKTALLSIDKTKLDRIDKQNPHPLLLQDIMSESALFHATVLPLKNIKSTKGNNFDTVRNIIYDSIRIDENKNYFETLKWLVFEKWKTPYSVSPSFSCPHPQCRKDVNGFLPDSNTMLCPHCKKEVFLTDMIGFHLDMEEDSAAETVATAYMLIMEILMLFTIVRIFWNHSDKSLFSETLFIKDGPLSLRSQYSKLVPCIRDFIEYSKMQKRPINLVGQEKSGIFADHLSSFSKYIKPLDPLDKPQVAVLTHNYVIKEVYRSSDQTNPYGVRTNWGEKVYVKLDPNIALVINIPTGMYNSDPTFPSLKDLVGIERILSTLPGLVSRKFESALYPIELANGIASLSNYPSAKILERFIESKDQCFF